MTDSGLIPVDAMQQLIRLDAETGKLFWLPRPDNKSFTSRYGNTEAMTALNGSGYRVGNFGGRLYRAHHVVFALHTGSWPVTHLDHINGDRLDNRPANLRQVTRTENNRNMGRSKANRSGVTGVCWCSLKNLWNAYIGVDGRKRSLGYHATIEAAAAARKAAEADLGYHINHGSERNGFAA